LNKNVTIVIIILVLVVVVGYLVWLRSKYQAPVTPQVQEQVQITPTPEVSITATPSATPGGKEATGSMKQKTGTAPAMVK